MAGEFLKAMRGGRTDPEIPTLKLCASPSHFEGARNGIGTPGFRDQREQRLSGRGGQSHEGKLEPAPRLNHGAAPKAENGIHYGTYGSTQIASQRRRRLRC